MATMKKLTRYKEIESFLFSQLPMFQRIGPKAFKTDLHNITRLLALLGDPQDSLRCIHVAGTNGKGSSCFMLAAYLGRLGYKTGLYTSPHYSDYRERVRIDGQKITRQYVSQFVNRLIDLGVFESGMKPSFFEITVALAFQYFKDEGVEWAVIETGLGGRLDSTNVITPAVSLITNIGMDHTAFLGDTLEKIAFEKAGIIKPAVPVVIAKTQAETEPVFRQKASALKAPITFADKQASIPFLEKQVKAMPAYQRENIYGVYAALKCILPAGELKKIERVDLAKDMQTWGFVGRYQRIAESPVIILDSAHNREGIIAMMDQLSSESYKHLHIVMAVVNDKDLEAVLNLFPQDASYYFSQADIPRALDRHVLKDQAGRYGLNGKSYTTVRRAFAAAKRKAEAKDLILVCGSIFTVAELV